MAVISVEQNKISVRQNSTVEQLTILATVFLPLTFVTGFFGQNFGWLVRHQDSFTAFAIALPAAPDGWRSGKRVGEVS
jgi:magnesium transporter